MHFVLSVTAVYNVSCLSCIHSVMILDFTKTEKICGVINAFHAFVCETNFSHTSQTGYFQLPSIEF